MVLDDKDRALIAAVQGGLPLVPQPYKVVAEGLELTEDEVMYRLNALVDQGVIKRFGIVVRHRELGYRANAMVVWDVPDDRVADVGRRLGEYDCVTLCYRRPRRLPLWPYNLFCMVHGLDRTTVRHRIEEITRLAGLQKLDRDILFSGQRFKQRGARYFGTEHQPRHTRAVCG